MPGLDCQGCGSYFKKFTGKQDAELCNKCAAVENAIDDTARSVVQVRLLLVFSRLRGAHIKQYSRDTGNVHHAPLYSVSCWTQNALPIGSVVDVPGMVLSQPLELPRKVCMLLRKSTIYNNDFFFIVINRSGVPPPAGPAAKQRRNQISFASPRHEVISVDDSDEDGDSFQMIHDQIEDVKPMVGAMRRLTSKEHVPEKTMAHIGRRAALFMNPSGNSIRVILKVVILASGKTSLTDVPDLNETFNAEEVSVCAVVRRIDQLIRAC